MFFLKKRAFFQVFPSPILFLQKSIMPWNSYRTSLIALDRFLQTGLFFSFNHEAYIFKIKYIPERGIELQLKAEEKEISKI